MIEPTEWVTSLTQQTGFAVEPCRQIAVVTQEPHFLNPLRYLRGKLSCAVDCFLEIWCRVLGPLIPNAGGSEFIDLLSILKTEYDSVVHMCMSVIRNGPTAMAGVGLNFHVIRERAWTILREKCSSFTAMDENAQFSQIFTKKCIQWSES